MDKLLKSDVNFQRVRDGRNALPFYFDLDLTTARSVAAGTHFIANVAGDSFYADANPIAGNCVVHFQDTNLDRAAVPFYVSPGFIANVPFTQMLIENAAQPGKKIRIAYGVDIDFQPGSVAQIAVSNQGGYTSIRSEASTGFFGLGSNIAANTPDTIVLPATNVNGLIVWSASFAINNATTPPVASFVAKNSAPATPFDGEIIVGAGLTVVLGAVFCAREKLEFPQFIAAGKGLYFIADTAGAAGNPGSNYRSCRYKVL